MKRLMASFVLIAAAAALSGCYYDPGYSYVRGTGYSGDAYYGQGNAYYVAPGYYDGYYGSGYYGYGCCYSPGVSIGWYGGPRYRSYRGHGYYRGGYHGSGGYHGGYHGGYQGHGGHNSGRPSSGGGHTGGGASHGGGHSHGSHGHY